MTPDEELRAKMFDLVEQNVIQIIAQQALLEVYRIPNWRVRVDALMKRHSPALREHLRGLRDIFVSSQSTQILPLDWESVVKKLIESAKIDPPA